jgi:hypothetical protein
MTTPIPSMVQAIARSISSRLPADEIEAFDAAVAAAAAGRDLSRLPWQFLAAELHSLVPLPPSIQADVDVVIAGIDRLANGQEWPGATDAAKSAAVKAFDWNARYVATDWAVDEPTAKYTRALRAAIAASAYVILTGAARAGWVAIPAAIAVAATALGSSAAAVDAGPPAARRQRDLLLQLLADQERADG